MQRDGKRIDSRRLHHVDMNPGHFMVVATLGPIVERASDSFLAGNHQVADALHRFGFDLRRAVVAFGPILDFHHVGQIAGAIFQFDFEWLAGGNAIDSASEREVVRRGPRRIAQRIGESSQRQSRIVRARHRERAGEQADATRYRDGSQRGTAIEGHAPIERGDFRLGLCHRGAAQLGRAGQRIVFALVEEFDRAGKMIAHAGEMPFDPAGHDDVAQRLPQRWKQIPQHCPNGHRQQRQRTNPSHAAIVGPHQRIRNREHHDRSQHNGHNPAQSVEHQQPTDSSARCGDLALERVHRARVRARMTVRVRHLRHRELYHSAAFSKRPFGD